MAEKNTENGAFTEASGNSTPAQRARFKIMRGKRYEITKEEWEDLRREGDDGLEKWGEVAPF